MSKSSRIPGFYKLSSDERLDKLKEFADLTNEETEMLLAAIRMLPADRQELLILKFVEKLSNKEIGNTMRRSEGAIKSLYHRTLMTLRQNLNTKMSDQ